MERLGYTDNMLKYIASCILYLLVLIVTLFSANAAQEWFPHREDLAVISLRSAIIVDGVTLLLIGAVVYLIARTIQI
jgi:hypothetical protein